MRALAAFIATVGLLLAAAPVHAQPVKTGHLEAQLVTETKTATPGSTLQAGLSQKIKTDWHTYWRNPGDSGEATKIVWTLPAGWSAGDIVWPTPHRLPVGPLLNYGYADQVILPLSIKVPASAKPGQTYKLKAAVAFLVCADICVPEDAVLTLDVPVAAGPPAPDAQWGPKIAKALADAPKPAGLTATFQGGPETVKLAVAGAPLAGKDFSDAYFYPYDGTVIDHAGAQKIERGKNGLTLTLVSNVAFQMGKPPATMAGVLALKDAAYEVTAASGAAPAGTSGLGPPPGGKSADGSGGGGSAPIGLLVAALFAFGGGLVLNLMPCVFPVLSMKAASLAAHADDPRATRAQGLAFLAGVMVTFLALAGALIAARAAGEAVGWGFQLQSPAVVATLSLIMLLTALNLSGVFEIGTSVQGLGSGLASKGGMAGAAFTGALAVIVAAPCTAPFMAPALGYALTQPPIVALVIFAALGLGMAAPFTLLAFLPKLLAKFPRPGAWMETFRRALSFPMYAAAAWLVWVLAQQTDAGGLAKALAAVVLVALGAWLYGRSQSGANTTPKRWTLTAAGAAVVVLAAAMAIVSPYAAPASAAAAGGPAKAGELASEPYSPERLAELRSAGTPVFVDFTAAWCITCKVNERTALASGKVIDAFAKTGTVYLVGDWTNRNAQIASVLDQFGRPGVPLYLVYGAKGQEAVVLPQLLTEGVVAKALETAAS